MKLCDMCMKNKKELGLFTTPSPSNFIYTDDDSEDDEDVEYHPTKYELCSDCYEKLESTIRDTILANRPLTIKTYCSSLTPDQVKQVETYIEYKMNLLRTKNK